MSKRKDILRAMEGNSHRSPEIKRMGRIYICANCGEPLLTTFVKVEKLYFHENCPKLLSKKVLEKVRGKSEAQ